MAQAFDAYLIGTSIQRLPNWHKHSTLTQLAQAFNAYLKNQDDLKNQDNLKNQDDLKNEDNLKNENDLKNEDKLKNKENLKNEEDPIRMCKKAEIFRQSRIIHTSCIFDNESSWLWSYCYRVVIF